MDMNMMKTFLLRARWGLAALALAATGLVMGAVETATPTDHLRSAPHFVQAEKLPVIAATRAGTRVVAVGDYGGVLLSDDGKAFHQARAVPTRSVLTSVFFLDAQRGWAAGHDGTVLATSDGGETWAVLREELGKERALMSVWFENAQHGLAVGQFGLVVETEDGGKTWRERHLVDNAEQGERHLMALFAGPQGHLYAAAESGAVFRSTDNGHNWAMVQTDNKGSFWAGLSLKDGSLLLVGLRGHIYRSTDLGQHWQEVPSGTQQSLTAVVQLADGKVEAVGMSGAVLTSADNGATFAAKLREDRVNLTTLVPGASAPLLFSLGGLVAAAP
jgi:photosystem II stability/assembly factor-like uncharacterized protein